MEPIIECTTIDFCELEKWFIFLLPFIVGFLSFWIGYLTRVLGNDKWITDLTKKEKWFLKRIYKRW